MKCFFILGVLFFSLSVLACGQSAKSGSGSINDELNEVQKSVDADFSYKFLEKPEDLEEVKRAALVLVNESGHINKSKAVHVYWKKTEIKDEDVLKKGYLILVLDGSSGNADFGSFYSGAKQTTLEDFNSLGFLAVKNEHADCEDCQGGLWTQSYIEKVANKLLERKPLELFRGK